MKAPSDYDEQQRVARDLNTVAIGETDTPMTISKVVDRFHSNKPVTDEMINDACRQIDSVYHFKNQTPSNQPKHPLRKLFKSVF